MVKIVEILSHIDVSSSLLNLELMDPVKTTSFYSPGYHPGVVRE